MSADRRPRPARARYDALCCACGQVRTVAQSYRGRKPKEVPASDGVAPPSCTWLRCSHCSSVTLHAVIKERSRGSGCARERQDRELDRQRRRIERRLVAFAAEGIAIVRDVPADDMQLDGAVIELVQDDAVGLMLHISAAAVMADLLRGLEALEDLLDVPGRLGTWTIATTSGWRGIAWRY